jgi:hypothetical protein
MMMMMKINSYGLENRHSSFGTSRYFTLATSYRPALGPTSSYCAVDCTGSYCAGTADEGFMPTQLYVMPNFRTRGGFSPDPLRLHVIRNFNLSMTCEIYGRMMCGIKKTINTRTSQLCASKYFCSPLREFTSHEVDSNAK